ncbi:YARHG domain-containing protein [Butyrivibrio sp. AE3006]|uniref:YARHG domain-containing protein n=1 Tax=Butyrivibrio sp. AE3006 TaxID=1280673 RepID=UPI000413C10E|nr:YARHG domain-containing protein [Butyrivibrio sp. AE3006]
MNKFFSIMIIISMFIVSGCSASDVTDQIVNVSQAIDEHVLGVKKGHPYSHPDITYEQAFENFFGAPTWKYFVGTKDGPDDDEDGKPDYTEDNVDIVEFTGYCTYSNVEVKALLQFTLSKDDDTFEATYLSFNEVPQSSLIMYALIEKAFDEYQSTHKTETSDTEAKENSVPESTYTEELVNEAPSEQVATQSMNYSSDVDYDELQDTIMIYYSNYYGTNNVAAAIDHEDNDSVTIWLYDPYATTTSTTLGFYDYNKNTGEWTDSITGEPLDFDAAASNYEENLAARSGYSEYILWYSSDEYLTESDLSWLSAKELTYARNEIYARHGYVFKSSELNNYFCGLSWYEPDPYFDGTLQGIEESNVAFIKNYQEQHNMMYKPN